jgi:hypothetical protein
MHGVRLVSTPPKNTAGNASTGFDERRLEMSEGRRSIGGSYGRGRRYYQGSGGRVQGSGTATAGKQEAGSR